MSLKLFLLDLEELHKLISEAEDKHFPDSELLDRLTNAVNEAEKCALVANQLVSKKVRTRLIALLIFLFFLSHKRYSVLNKCL